jgi:hypothetical protein
MQTQTFLNGMAKVTKFLDAVDTIWGITGTYGEHVVASGTVFDKMRYIRH